MPKDDSTWLNIAYGIFFVLAAFVYYKLLESAGVRLGWVERYSDWFPTVSSLLSMVLGGGTTLWLRSDPERNEYFLSAISETRKVTFPSWDDTKKMTLIVVVVVGVFSAILSVFDIAWARILKLLLT